MEEGEIDVHGLYIAKLYADDPEGLLETIYTDFAKFLSAYGIGGDAFPIFLEQGETECFEAYSIEVLEDKIMITAKDTEGIRRALVFLEDELQRSENAFLKPAKMRNGAHVAEKRKWT